MYYPAYHMPQHHYLAEILGLINPCTDILDPLDLCNRKLPTSISRLPQNDHKLLGIPAIK